jgi:hypothetical protein
MSLSNEFEFEALRRERAAQYGVSIAYVKERVDPGTEYANEVARAVLSPRGGYFELTEMPEEFAGALGSGVSSRMVAEEEALEIVSRLKDLARDVVEGVVSPRVLSLYVLYAGGSLRTRREMFVLDHKPGIPLFAHGALRQETVPRFVKVRIETGPEEDSLRPYAFTAGVHFLLAPSHTDGGRCLLGTFTRTPGQSDLTGCPASLTLN